MTLSLGLVLAGCAEFPKELHLYGLTEELLTSTFSHVLAEKGTLPWQVKGVPNVGFYRAIHPYLKKRHPKVKIGKFYISIDHNLKEKGSRPDNVYRFIDGVTQSKQQSDKPMVYDHDHYQSEVKDMTAHLKQCTRQLSMECLELKERFKTTNDRLQASELALRDLTNEKMHLERQRDISKHKVKRLKDQHKFLEEEFV